jgi:hypothetical protein
MMLNVMMMHKRKRTSKLYLGTTRGRYKVLHPYRVKYFRKVVSTVMDDLDLDDAIIENMNLIVKLGNIVNKDSLLRGFEGVIRYEWFQMMMMIRWIQYDDN